MILDASEYVSLSLEKYQSAEGHHTIDENRWSLFSACQSAVHLRIDRNFQTQTVTVWLRDRGMVIGSYAIRRVSSRKPPPLSKIHILSRGGVGDRMSEILDFGQIWSDFGCFCLTITAKFSRACGAKIPCVETLNTKIFSRLRRDFPLFRLRKVEIFCAPSARFSPVVYYEYPPF